MWNYFAIAFLKLKNGWCVSFRCVAKWLCTHTHTHTHMYMLSVTKSCPTLRPYGLQHTRLPCPSPPPRVCSRSHPLSSWCYLTIIFRLFSITACYKLLSRFPCAIQWVLVLDWLCLLLLTEAERGCGVSYSLPDHSHLEQCLTCQEPSSCICLIHEGHFVPILLSLHFLVQHTFLLFNSELTTDFHSVFFFRWAGWNFLAPWR